MPKSSAVTVKLGAESTLLVELLNGEGYGLELIERVQLRSGGAVHLTPGNIYPALRRLEAERLVISKEMPGQPERGGRARISYRLTADGRRSAQAQREGLLAFLAQPAVEPQPGSGEGGRK